MEYNTRYKDFSLNFSSVPSTGDLSCVKNETSISQSLKNIILTNQYERLFNPDFSGDISSMLFDNWTSVKESLMKTRIENAIRNYEPRVNVISIIVRAEPDSNLVNITIIYRAKTSTQNLSVSIILERVY